MGTENEKMFEIKIRPVDQATINSVHESTKRELLESFLPHYELVKNDLEKTKQKFEDARKTGDLATMRTVLNDPTLDLENANASIRNKLKVIVKTESQFADFEDLLYMPGYVEPDKYANFLTTKRTNAEALKFVEVMSRYDQACNKLLHVKTDMDRYEQNSKIVLLANTKPVLNEILKAVIMLRELTDDHTEAVELVGEIIGSGAKISGGTTTSSGGKKPKLTEYRLQLPAGEPYNGKIFAGKMMNAGMRALNAVTKTSLFWIDDAKTVSVPTDKDSYENSDATNNPHGIGWKNLVPKLHAHMVEAIGEELAEQVLYSQRGTGAMVNHKEV